MLSEFTIEGLSLLTEAAVKSVVILAATCLCALLLFWTSSAVRHLVWSLGLISVVALPFLSLLLPEIPTQTLNSAMAVDRLEKLRSSTAVRAARSESTPTSDRVPPAPTGSDLQTVDRSADPTGQPLIDHAAAPPDRQYRLTVIFLGTWVVGVGLILAQLLIQMLRRESLATNAQPAQNRRVLQLVGKLQKDLNLKRAVRVLESTDISVPATWGYWRPVLLLPSASGSWPESKLTEVLRHELAHVKRGDYVTQLVSRSACALYWFNPLVWISSFRLRIEQETACDDQVLNSGMLPSDYGRHLLEIARSLHGRNEIAWSSVPIVHYNELSGRIRAILDDSRDRRQISRLWGFGAVMLVVGVLGPLAAAKPTSAVDDLQLPVSVPSDQLRSNHQLVVDLTGPIETETEITPVSVAATSDASQLPRLPRAHPPSPHRTKTLPSVKSSDIEVPLLAAATVPLASGNDFAGPGSKVANEEVAGFRIKPRLGLLWGNDFRPASARGMVQLANALDKQVQINVEIDQHVHLSSRKIFQYPFVCIQVDKAFEHTDSESRNLADYLRGGGFAFLESVAVGVNYSPVDAALRSLMRDALGSEGQFHTIPNDHPIYHGFYDFNDGPPGSVPPPLRVLPWVHRDSLNVGIDSSLVRGAQPQSRYLEGIFLQNELVAVLSDKAYVKAWELKSRNQPQLQMGINLVVFALARQGSLSSY